MLVSAVHAGIIEYWRSSGHAFPEADVSFSSKLDTDLYALAKAKARVHSLEVSRDGAQFATFSSDRWPPRPGAAFLHAGAAMPLLTQHHISAVVLIF